MPIVAIEGFDGVGKTTVAHEFAARLGGIVVTDTPLEDSWREERRALNAGADVDTRFEYFLRLNRHYMALAQEASHSDGLAVMDSSVYRTVATHRVLSSSLAHAYLLEPDLTPDLTALLVTSEETRVDRMVQRDGGLKFSSHWDEKLHECHADVLGEYARFGLPLIEATVSVDQVVEQVLREYAGIV